MDTPPYVNDESIDSTMELLATSGLFLDPQIEEVLRLVLRRGNAILYGPPGTGKTRCSFAVEKWWSTQFGKENAWVVTFHPSYGYEDFVLGFRPDPEKPEAYALQEGILLLAAKQAQRNIDEASDGADPTPVILLIDEINRADVARVFGELITFIERDKRETEFRLAQQPELTRTIPHNLFFLATMNTADKSISLLDVALRRRFAFVEFPPDPKSFASFPGWEEKVSAIDMGSLLLGLNARLRSEGVEADRAVGQGVLAVDTNGGLEGLRERLRFDVQPLIEEYCYFDRSRIGAVLGSLVDDNGRLRATMSDDELVNACLEIAGTGVSPDVDPVAEAQSESLE